MTLQLLEKKSTLAAGSFQLELDRTDGKTKGPSVIGLGTNVCVSELGGLFGYDRVRSQDKPLALGGVAPSVDLLGSKTIALSATILDPEIAPTCGTSGCGCCTARPDEARTICRVLDLVDSWQPMTSGTATLTMRIGGKTFTWVGRPRAALVLSLSDLVAGCTRVYLEFEATDPHAYGPEQCCESVIERDPLSPGLCWDDDLPDAFNQQGPNPGACWPATWIAGPDQRHDICIVSSGTACTFPRIEVDGPICGPIRVINRTHNKFWLYNHTVASNTSMVADFRTRQVCQCDSDFSRFVDPVSDWFALNPCEQTELRILVNGPTGSTVRVCWRDAWL